MGGTLEKPQSHWGKGAPRVRTKVFWKDALKWNATAAREQQSFECNPHQARFCGNKYDRPRVFPSLCDWLDDEVPIEWLVDFLKLIHETRNLDWLLLSKRPESWQERMVKALEYAIDSNEAARNDSLAPIGFELEKFIRGWLDRTVPQNVWIGVSVEDQKRADERIPELLKIPSKVRFLSAEPLLGSIDFGFVMEGSNGPAERSFAQPTEAGQLIDWVIFGGESGPNSRVCKLDWIHDGIRQCRWAGIAPFVKQLGANFEPRLFLADKKGGNIDEFPNHLKVREWPN